MTEHYFSEKPQSKSSPKTWKYTLRDNNFIFTSDIGVFSKNEVDFGSKLLIEEFQLPSKEGDILDMGCGYGPIGITLAHEFPERKIVMVDVNERAISLAKKNAEQNGVNNNVEFISSDLFQQMGERKFAAILTNPPIRAGKKVVHEIFDESKDYLHKDGELWVVIQKKQGAPSAKTKLEQLFGDVTVVAKQKGYYILRAINV